MSLNAVIARIGLAAVFASVACVAHADSPVRFVVTFPAGGSTDNIARALAEALHEVTAKQYIVDNRPGAGGTIATQEVVRAKPDGNTLLFTTGSISTNAALYKKLPYDTLKDLTPITKLTESKGFLLIVPASSPYKTLGELVAAARANPGKLSYGSSGIGNTPHLAGALFERAAHVTLIHVPYKASPFTDLIGGQIDMMFWGASFATSYVQSGKVRALAVASEARLDTLPDVPTLAERGIKGVDVPAWSGVFAPGGMSKDLLDRLRGDIDQAMKRPSFIEAVRQSGGTPAPMTPPAFAAQVRAEIVRFQKDLPALGINMD